MVKRCLRITAVLSYPRLSVSGRAFCFWALLLIRSASAAAQGLEFPATPSPQPLAKEEVLFQDIPSVYGASKYEQKVTEAPSSVTVITSDEIKKYGYRTLADILQSVNGFYVTSDRSYSYLGVRGFNQPGDFNSRVLLTVDGHRLNDNLYDQAGLGTEAPVDIDLIDRVEIIRGPSSSLYGANAVFAVINVITKRGRDIKGQEFSSEIGSHSSHKARVTYGNKFANGLELLLSGAFYDSQGHGRLFYKEYNSPETNNGIAKNADDDRFYNLFAKLSFSDLTVQAGFLNREKGAPNAPYFTVFNTDQTRNVDEHTYVDIKYEREIAKYWEFTTRFYYDRYYYRGNFLYGADTAVPSFVLNQDHGLGELWGGETRVTRRFMETHRVTLGVEYRDNFRRALNNTDRNPFTRYFKDDRRLRNFAWFAQDEVTLFTHLIFNASVRYDYYDSFSSTLNPRLALIYNWNNTNIKLIYGTAFRAPNAYEQFYAGPGQKANLHLKPEEITSYEVILEHYLNTHLRASVAGYSYTINGLISQETDLTDGLLVFKNINRVEAKGLEFELDGKWLVGLEGRLSYAVQESKDLQTGRYLTNSPQHMVKLNVLAPLIADKLFVGIETRYLSERLTLAGKHAPDAFVTNLTLFSQNVFGGLEASGSIYNLFDEKYSDPGSADLRQDLLEQDGRTFWMKLKYSF